MRYLANQGTPALMSVTRVNAINLRHESGTTYRHTAQYTVVALGSYAGATPVTSTLVVSGMINAANCAATLLD